MAETVSKIFQEKGGASAVADALGVKPSRVRMWKLRGRIPRPVWPEVIEAYPDVTLERLKALEAA